MIISCLSSHSVTSLHPVAISSPTHTNPPPHPTLPSILVWCSTPLAFYALLPAFISPPPPGPYTDSPPDLLLSKFLPSLLGSQIHHGSLPHRSSSSSSPSIPFLNLGFPLCPRFLPSYFGISPLFVVSSSPVSVALSCLPYRYLPVCLPLFRLSPIGIAQSLPLSLTVWLALEIRLTAQLRGDQRAYVTPPPLSQRSRDKWTLML